MLSFSLIQTALIHCHLRDIGGQSCQRRQRTIASASCVSNGRLVQNPGHSSSCSTPWSSTFCKYSECQSSLTVLKYRSISISSAKSSPYFISSHKPLQNIAEGERSRARYVPLFSQTLFFQNSTMSGTDNTTVSLIQLSLRISTGFSATGHRCRLSTENYGI